MKQAELGLDDSLEADIAFHLCILDASENRFFIQLGRIIDTTLRVSIRFTNRLRGVKSAAYSDHKKIYDAIVRQQPDKAAKESEKLATAAAQLIGAASVNEFKDKIN